MKLSENLNIIQTSSTTQVSWVKRFFKIALITLLVCLLIVMGIVMYFYRTSAAVRSSIDVIINGTYKPSIAFPGRSYINVLLMGRDFDRNNKGEIVETNGRTDSMMLAHIDFADKKVDILSIPRDTLVHIPGYRHKTRISYANSFGGPQLAVDTVEELLKVKPDYYLLVNFKSFESAIDELGGLKIDVDKKLDYDDNWGNLHIHLEPGMQILNGEQAMGYVRYRKSNDGGGDSDLVRIERQQQFISAMSNKLRSPGALIKVPSILASVNNDIDGDLTTAQIICIAKFIKSLHGNECIKTHTIPSTDESLVYVHVDEDAARRLVEEIFGN